MQSFSAIKYIGADDDNLDLFEGQYPIPNGISYNSYFIPDRHTAIIDTVDTRRCADWLANLRAAVAETGAEPEYVVVQHVEPDHSGSLAALLDLYPTLRIVCTPKAGQMLEAFFNDIDIRSRLVAVADGDILDLGRVQLRFITAPMVHWPEVMMTLDETDGVLFSADAFGTFAMWGSTAPWDDEARRYYTNIVGRFGANVQSVMKKLARLSFQAVAPLHGPAITHNLSHYWQLYDKWSRYEPETEGVLVAYASVYGGTAEAARRLATMLRAAGAGEVVTFDLCRHHVSYAVAEAFRLSRMALASVTYDADLFPAMHDFIHHIAAKRLANRTIGLIENGSWAPLAAKLMAAELAPLKNVTIAEPVVTLNARLSPTSLQSLATLALTLAQSGK